MGKLSPGLGPEAEGAVSCTIVNPEMLLGGSQGRWVRVGEGGLDWTCKGQGEGQPDVRLGAVWPG